MSVSWPLAFGGAFQGALTGRDNAKCISRIYGRDIRDTVDYVQDFAELGVYFDEPVRNYSSGMAARLAFAISMSIEFDCFLIDEIVHVGDHRFHEKCQIELFEKRADRSLVIVSHNEDFVREHCDRAYVLTEGKLRAFGHVDDAIDFHIETLHNRGVAMAQEATHVSADPNDQYVLGRDSLPQDGVAQGRITTLTVPPSRTFPNCHHEAWLYTPPHYDGVSPLPLSIFFDGWWFLADDGPWQVTTVLNNLIASKAIPRWRRSLSTRAGRIPLVAWLKNRNPTNTIRSMRTARSSCSKTYCQKRANMSFSPTGRKIGCWLDSAVAAFVPLPQLGNAQTSLGKYFPLAEVLSIFGVEVLIPR
jgi:capsular polysaccharide transport system ATP-binding protein